MIQQLPEKKLSTSDDKDHVRASKRNPLIHFHVHQITPSPNTIINESKYSVMLHTLISARMNESLQLPDSPNLAIKGHSNAQHPPCSHDLLLSTRPNNALQPPDPFNIFSTAQRRPRQNGSSLCNVCKQFVRPVSTAHATLGISGPDQKLTSLSSFPSLLPCNEREKKSIESTAQR